MSLQPTKLASRAREGILPLHFAPVRHHIGIQLWDPQQKKDTDMSEQVQRRANKQITGLEYLSYEGRLRARAVQPGEEKGECRALPST